ncbi:MAG: hypothetical protein WD400_03270 [Pontimonas sp.]
MKAQPADQAKLLEVQDIDVSISRATSQRANLPERGQLAELEAPLAQARAQTRRTLAELEELRAELVRAENDVELVETRIVRDQKRVEESSSVKDVQGLQHELGVLRERLGVLEEVELEVMERVEQAQKASSAAQEQAHLLEAQMDQVTRSLAAALAGSDEELTTLRASRVALTATIPEDLLGLYERQRERYGYGASLLRAGMSGASGVKLTESDLQTVRKSAEDDVVLCPDSNAILVRTHESGLS